MRTLGYMLACEKVCYFLFNIFCKKKKKNIAKQKQGLFESYRSIIVIPRDFQAGVMDLFMGKDWNLNCNIKTFNDKFREGITSLHILSIHYFIYISTINIQQKLLNRALSPKSWWTNRYKKSFHYCCSIILIVNLWWQFVKVSISSRAKLTSNYMLIVYFCGLLTY